MRYFDVSLFTESRPNEDVKMSVWSWNSCLAEYFCKSSGVGLTCHNCKINLFFPVFV